MEIDQAAPGPARRSAALHIAVISDVVAGVAAASAAGADG